MTRKPFRYTSYVLIQSPTLLKLLFSLGMLVQVVSSQQSLYFFSGPSLSEIEPNEISWCKTTWFGLYVLWVWRKKIIIDGNKLNQNCTIWSLNSFSYKTNLWRKENLSCYGSNMYYSFKIRSHWACSPHTQMFKMFSWLEGTQVLKTAEQWLSALKREDGVSIDFTNGKSL